MLLQVLYEGLTMGTIYALLAMGIALVWGVMNILSFSQGEFMMVAMYMTFFINQVMGWDPLACTDYRIDDTCRCHNHRCFIVSNQLIMSRKRGDCSGTWGSIW